MRILFLLSLTLVCLATLQSDLQGQQTYVVDNAVLTICEEKHVPSLTSGVISKALVREGSIVKFGQLIAEIDSESTSMEIEKLQAELELANTEAASSVDQIYAQKTIDVSQAELNRAWRTNQRSQGAVSQSELDQLTMEVEKSRAELEKILDGKGLKFKQARIRDIDLKMGRRDLKDHRIKASVKGMVVEVFKKQGEWIDASEPFVRIVRLDKLRAEVRVPASFALRGIRGRTGEFVPSLESLKSRKYPAKIVFVHPEANPVNATVRVWVEIDNPDLKLVSGLAGRLTIQCKDPKEDSSEPGDTNPKNLN